MFGMIGLELISGSSFLEVLRNLVLEYVPDGERVLMRNCFWLLALRWGFPSAFSAMP